MALRSRMSQPSDDCELRVCFQTIVDSFCADIGSDEFPFETVLVNDVCDLDSFLLALNQLIQQLVHRIWARLPSRHCGQQICGRAFVLKQLLFRVGAMVKKDEPLASIHSLIRDFASNISNDVIAVVSLHYLCASTDSSGACFAFLRQLYTFYRCNPSSYIFFSAFNCCLFYDMCVPTSCLVDDDMCWTVAFTFVVELLCLSGLYVGDGVDELKAACSFLLDMDKLSDMAVSVTEDGKFLRSI